MASIAANRSYFRRSRIALHEDLQNARLFPPSSTQSNGSRLTRFQRRCGCRTLPQTQDSVQGPPTDTSTPWTPCIGRPYPAGWSRFGFSGAHRCCEFRGSLQDLGEALESAYDLNVVIDKYNVVHDRTALVGTCDDGLAHEDAWWVRRSDGRRLRVCYLSSVMSFAAS
jgi:hypothetical protein